jgi:twitching motility protein PilT
LAGGLQGVISQQLLPSLQGGRALATEILIPNPAIRSQIREDKLHMVYQSMQMNSEKSGNQTLNQCLINLVQRRLITVETAVGAANDLDELKSGLARLGIGKAG